jgi:hypothetical protein
MKEIECYRVRLVNLLQTHTTEALVGLQISSTVVVNDVPAEKRKPLQCEFYMYVFYHPSCMFIPLQYLQFNY